MKIQKLIVISFALLSMSFANALEIVDVTVDHWASQEIIRAIQNNYIQVVEQNKFKPEGTMTRSEFVNSLLKVINRQNEKVVQGQYARIRDAGRSSVYHYLLLCFHAG